MSDLWQGPVGELVGPALGLSELWRQRWRWWVVGCWELLGRGRRGERSGLAYLVADVDVGRGFLVRGLLLGRLRELPHLSRGLRSV